MSLKHRSLEEFVQFRSRIAGVLQRTSAAYAALDEPECAERLVAVRDRLMSDGFTVVFMGAMKRGKSTLVNAVLGADLLPTQFGTACTAIPIAVMFGETPRAACHKRSGGAPDVCDPILEAKRFWETVTIPPKHQRTGPDDDATAFRLHPYSHADVEYPSAILKNGVRVEDSPGLNENGRRTEATWASCEEADAVVLVLDCAQVDLQTDRDDLRKIIETGRDAEVVFIVWNQFDRCRQDAAASDRVRAAAYEMVEAFGLLRDHVCFVSASEALEGKKTANPEQTRLSGIHEFEEVVGDFLMNERLTAKLISPLGDAERAVDDVLLDLIIRREAEWTQPAEFALAAVHAAQRHATGVDQLLDRLDARVGHAHERLKAAFVPQASGLVEMLAEGAGNAAEGVEVTALQAIFSAKESAIRVASEIEAWMKVRSAAWESDVLAPLIASFAHELEEIVQDTVASVQTHALEIAAIETRLREARQPGSLSKASDRVDTAMASSDSDRIVSQLKLYAEELAQGISAPGGAAVGALLGGVAGAWLIAALAFAVLWPVIILAAMGAWIGGAGAGQVLKGIVANKVARHVRERRGDLQAMFAKKADELGTTIAMNVTKQLKSFRVQIRLEVTAIEKTSEERRKAANAARRRAGELRATLQSDAAELATLRREIDPTSRRERSERPAPGSGRAGASDADARSASQEHEDDLGKAAALLELKNKFDRKNWARLQATKEYLKQAGRWTPDMELRLADWWHWCDKSADPRQVKQVPTFRTVAAWAVSMGATLPPEPKDITTLWLDPNDRKELMRLWLCVQAAREEWNSVEVDVFTDDEPGKFGKAGDRFCTAYERALTNMVKSGAPWGTVIDGKWHRDAPRSDD